MKKKIVWLPYDMDTAIGINNEGSLVFGYNLEDTDHLPGGADIYNGQESVVWCNLRDAFPDELKAMYQNLRQTGKISYALVEKMFEDHQDKWPEAVFNEDAWFKYIAPLIEDGTASYLAMAQGSKEEQRKWWLYNRFRYLDSKYNAGDALSDLIQIRGYAKSDITITPYADIYPTVKFGSVLVSTRGAHGEETTLECPLDNVNDTEIYIYSASQLASVGDLSGFKVGFADFSMATKLQSIKVGDNTSGYENPNLTELYVGNNVLLGTVDARNCSALSAPVDLSGAVNVEHVYFEGTAVTAVSLPVGGILKTLHLPGTITNLTVRNQGAITSFVMPSYANITTLRVENCPAIPVDDILAEIPENSRVRILGFTATMSTTEEVEDFYDFLDTMRGLDESGNTLDTAVVSGTITGLGTITAAWLAEMQARYPTITIQYEHISAQLKYYSYDGSTLINTETVVDGANGAYSGTPSRASTAQYSYTFVGWNTNKNATTNDPNATKAVTADRSVYAAYTATTRTYTVYWKNSNGTTLETDQNVPYGTVPAYNGSTPVNPTSGGGAFRAWTPTPAAISGDTTYTATYVPMYTVSFYNGSTFITSTTVQEGGTAVYSGSTPVNSEDASLAFLGWASSAGQTAADPNILTNITANKSVYAAFESSLVPTATTADGAYGVEWNYSQSATTLTRKGLAQSFSNPTPATSKTGSGSSPFDTIAPWKDMKRYCYVNGSWVDDTDPSFDETAYDAMVYIPTFYYTAYKDTANSKWLWAISPTEKEGYKKHPGSGRYIGRFHTSGSSSLVSSKSGVAPLGSTTKADFRTYSHNKGSNWWQLDLATWSALQMLYLVEFADWNSQSVLGKGHNTGSLGTTGGTTGAAYHTMKMSSGDNMYRWVENPFSQMGDWCDGFVASNRNVYVGLVNASFGDTVSGLTDTGIDLPSSNNYITGFGYSAKAPYAFIPDANSDGSSSTFVSDHVASGNSVKLLGVGGLYNSSDSYGFFYYSVNFNAAETANSVGSRLIYVP